MPENISMIPIGVVHSRVTKPLDDVWGGLISSIELDAAQFTPEALEGLVEFSHVMIVFVLDRIENSAINYGAKHPRGRTDWPKVGIFAQRAKNRPNRIAITTCRLLGVEGLTVTLEGLDAIDGTPVLDIKPYLAGFAPQEPVREPAWSLELMAGYWNKMPE
jgi:tRNA-Thr(GGU) m(6)t(6)A37 methyltransferase TsaA